jgi:hypothetical protein
VGWGGAKTAWKMGHAIRELIDLCAESPPLYGIAGPDENYFGGKPRFKKSIKHKSVKGTSKQPGLVAAQRKGAVRSAPVDNDSAAECIPWMEWIQFNFNKKMQNRLSY